MSRYLYLTVILLICTVQLQAQGIIRGNIFDAETGEPVIYANVYIEGAEEVATTNVDGFFTLSNIAPGRYVLITTYIGYDTLRTEVSLTQDQIVFKNLYLEPSSVELTTVRVSGRKEQARTEVRISTIDISPKQIETLPSTGGESDIAQYLQVIPGVISTGSQGGQIYIRGGAPIQNKIIMDGMTIYNPFHSIGFFSVFETETIRNVEVLTGGFGAEYGGRMSAVVDITTREGNRKRFGGLVSGSPFQVKGLLEGPIVPLTEDGNYSISFLLTGKHSILEQTSPKLYDYAIVDSIGSLPFNHTDIYGKVSVISDNGSKFDFFGFDYNDDVNYPGIARYQWESGGGGVNFKLIPSTSNLIINGVLAYSNYDIMEEIFNDQTQESEPKESSISNFKIGLDFSYYGENNELNYGLEFNGFSTDIAFSNPFNIRFDLQNNNTEVNSFFKYKQKIGALIIEPSIRLIYYASQGQFSPEPRLGLKVNATDFLRFKFAGGIYSQLLTSTVSERDIVNLFTGFLTGDELQKAYHAVFGVEVDLAQGMELNVEPYYKRYDKLLALNRNRLTERDPDFIEETGDAYGIDFLLRYDVGNIYFWGTYSLGYVTRDDGEQEYPAIFDRRHTVNLLASYRFGPDRNWEAGVRWNFGSGFRFTKILGYGERQDHGDLDGNPLTDNGELIPIYSRDLNRGVLPDYHRLDITLKKRFEISKYTNIEANVSVTNAYDRDNILFVNPLRTDDKLFQLPVLPSAGLKVEF
ncbi:MAG: carboxypeptidase-like regulatory domain-containing protein [Saprospiraceae bacterium]|nr:carboxypeptidase-like regulatory domain-containing protein [Saprospiraceae bacterium]